VHLDRCQSIVNDSDLRLGIVHFAHLLSVVAFECTAS
jgi:hypothetical protein